jgi:iron complex transport system permease protein
MSRGDVARGAGRTGRRPPVVLGILAVATLAASLLAVATGAVPIAPRDIVAIVLSRGFGIGAVPDPLTTSIVLEVRIPRVLAVALVGAALALAGVALQGVLGNPLADPGVLGLSAVAALASVLVLAVAGPAAPVGLLVVVGSGATVAAATYLVRLASRDGRVEVTTVLLGGIAIQAVAVATLTAVLTTRADPGLRTVGFWTFGSAGAVGPSTAAILLAVIVPTGLLLWNRAHVLDLLALGERAAAHLGVDVVRARRATLTAVSLLVAASAATIGIVAFVGLLVPHAARRLIGPAHRALLPASALAGATLLVLVDLAARTLFLPREVPLGTITALLGAPLFLLLLRAARDRQGGWV